MNIEKRIEEILNFKIALPADSIADYVQMNIAPPEVVRQLVELVESERQAAVRAALENIRSWSETAFKEGWINSREWPGGDDEVYESIRSYALGYRLQADEMIKRANKKAKQAKEGESDE